MLQDKALDLLKSGSNIFLTGAAGTGKTYLLNQFIEYLKSKEIKYSVTASTGIAATHLNGVTIHSWSGIGVKSKITPQDLNNLKKNIKYNYQTTKVLIIDEVSMLHAHQLDLVDTIARHLLDDTKPFGGMQVVLCGDFCQLPPVTTDNKDIVFAYESNSWKNSNISVCYLQKQYRQNERDELLSILNSIRNNAVNETLKSKLHSLHKEYDIGHTTKLYTNNIDVDSINNYELEKLKSKSYTFDMVEHGEKFAIEGLKKRCLAKEVLELKVGALVIFIQNDRDRQYVNGTVGVVQGFTKSGAPIIKTRDNIIYVTRGEWGIEDADSREIACISQLPLCLAWAITVHKSQGMTLDAAEIDLRRAFCYGMGYVALSRVRDSSGLNLLGFNEKSLQIDPKMLEQDKIFKLLSDGLK